MKHNLAIIIPTRNRIKLLVTTLRSIEKQSVLPHQVIVVDGSDKPLEKDLKKNLNLKFDYLYVNPPSLTKQRNAGVYALKDNCTIVGYLDDDVVVEQDAIKNMVTFWEKTDGKTGGVSFNIINNPISKPRSIYKFFKIQSNKRGAVLKAGFSTSYCPTTDLFRTEWLCGGATVWARHIVDNFKYDEWYSGTAYVEDVDFSFNVGKKYNLFVLPDARIQHNPPPYLQSKGFKLGEMDMTHRYYFVKKYFGKDVFSFYLSAIGLLITDLFLFFLKGKMFYAFKFFGNIYGLTKIIFNKEKKIDTDFRGE